MKHIKLFERFDDEEENWWDEESPLDNVYSKMEVVMIYGCFYLLEEYINDWNIILFPDYHFQALQQDNVRKMTRDIKVKNNDKIMICDSNKKYVNGWEDYYEFEHLPKEIKDRVLR